MAIDPNEFDDILKKFDKLTPKEREELIDRLERRQATANNGGQAGRSVLEAFKSRGLAGSIEDTPPDWSTNPKYMEGFGKNDGE